MKQKFKWLLALVAMVASINLNAALVGIPVTWSGTSMSQTTGAGTATITNSKNGTGHSQQNMAASNSDYWLFTIPVKNLESGTTITITLSGVKNNKDASKGTYTFKYSTNNSDYTNFGDTYPETTTATSVTRSFTLSSSISTGTLYIKMQMTSGGATNAGNHYLGDVSVTAETPELCSNSITITKGTESNGTFTLSQSGDVCIDEGNASVVVTGTPNSHYIFSSVTAEGATIGDISDNKCTVSNISKNTTITANFTAAPKATITLSEAGTDVAGPTDKYVGESYTLPSSVTHNCGTKIFVGWSTEEIASPGEKPEENFYNPGDEVTLKQNNKFYAVYATTGGVSELSETLQCTAGSISNDKMTFNSTNFTFVHAKGEASSFGSYSPWRLYIKNTLTISGTQTISKVEMVTDGTNYGAWTSTKGSVSVATSSGGTSSVTDINASSVTFTFTTQTRWSSIKVYYQGSAYSNYATTCSSDPMIEGLTINAAEPTDGKYWEPITATISCETEDVTITYSLDDGETWSPYEDGVQISSTSTLKAKATKTNFQDATTSKTFTFGKVYADIDAWYADVANIDDNEKIKITNVNAVISSFAGQGNTTVKFKNDQASFYTNGTGCPNTYAVGSVLVGSNIFFTCKPAYTPKQIRPTSWEVFTCVAALPNVTGLAEEWVNANTIKLKWNAVTNAGSYKVMFDNVEKDATTNTYLEISGLTPKSEHSWKVKALTSNESVALDGNYGSARNFTFPDAPHTVTFNGNGKGTPTETSLMETMPGEGVTLPSVTNVDDIYSFAGWATSSTATTADAGVAGATYNPTADIELFAVYLDVYTINWSANGQPLTPTKVIAGQKLVLPEEDPDPAMYCEGKTFMGWTSAETVNEDGSDITYAATGDEVSANTTYYAVFAEGSVSSGYTLVDAPEEGKIYIIVSSYEAGDAYALPATGLAETATASTAGTQITIIEKGGKIVVEDDYENLEFTYVSDDDAKWAITASTSDEYLVINGNGIGRVTSNYKAWWDETNGGLYGSNSKGTTYYDVYLDEENNFKAASGKEGSVFAYVKGGISYSGYTTDCCTKHEVKEGEMTIGGFTASPEKACAGTEVTLTPDDVTGYNFTSWTSSPEVTISAENKFEMPDEDVTITANYTAATYNIEYNLDGGEWDGEAGVATYTYGVDETLPTNVKKDGNNFAGWYAQGAEEPTTEIGATEMGDKSFIAHWIPATSRTITYIGADEHIEFTTKPMDISGEATELTIEYEIEEHYSLKDVTVKVGETQLTDEVTWDHEMIYVVAEGFADNVMITFNIQPIVFTVQWLVNGTPVKEIEHVLEGTTYGTLTAPEDPADDTFDNCDANKFMGWAVMDWEGTQTKADFEAVQVTDGYEIKENQTTFYAVFATEGEGDVKVGDVLWAEDFSGFSANDVPTTSNANTVVYGNASLTYTTEKSGTKIYDAKLAGGESPEILIAESGGSFGCSNIPTAGVAKMNFTFYSNKNSGISVSSSTTDITVGTLTYTGTSAPYIYSCEISNPNKLTTFQLQINKSQSSNSREDNISLTVAEAPVEITNFITKCVVTTYRVKFDANAPIGEIIGGTVPEAVDVDPTLDYTIPTDNYLTTNHYTQIGWNEDPAATTAQTTVEKMEAGENTTLYAIWQAKDFTISVETAPAKVEYKTNATFNPEGLVITKTYDGGFSEDVAYAGHESEFSFNPSLETPLSTAITEVTITYAGKTCTQGITVEDAVIPTYYWIANAEALQAGDQIILVCGEKNAIAGPMGEEKYFASEELTATINKGTVQVEDAYEFTLGKEGVNWTLTSSEGTIGATAAKALSTTSGTTTWTISFDEKGNALITSTTSGYGTIKYNSSSPRFLNYASGQTDIQIYAKRDTRKTLREELADGKMYSFCPAYNLAYVEGATFFQPDYMDAAYVHFVEATEIKAGYGYILEGKGDDLKAFEVGEALTEAVPADAENTRGMQGVLEDDKSEDKNGYQFTETSYNYALVSNNHLQYVGAGNVIPVERAYLNLSIIADLTAVEDDERPLARRVAINFGGQAPTNLNGLNGAVKPIKVMKDGQFYIIREAKMYNAQGIEVQ